MTSLHASPTVVYPFNYKSRQCSAINFHILISMFIFIFISSSFFFPPFISLSAVRCSMGVSNFCWRTCGMSNFCHVPKKNYKNPIQVCMSDCECASMCPFPCHPPLHQQTFAHLALQHILIAIVAVVSCV